MILPSTIYMHDNGMLITEEQKLEFSLASIESNVCVWEGVSIGNLGPAIWFISFLALELPQMSWRW